MRNAGTPVHDHALGGIAEVARMLSAGALSVWLGRATRSHPAALTASEIDQLADQRLLS